MSHSHNTHKAITNKSGIPTYYQIQNNNKFSI